MIFLVWNIRSKTKKQKRQPKNRLLNIENKLVVARMEVGREIGLKRKKKKKKKRIGTFGEDTILQNSVLETLLIPVYSGQE